MMKLTTFRDYTNVPKNAQKTKGRGKGKPAFTVMVIHWFTKLKKVADSGNGTFTACSDINALLLVES
jgi:hypothetical protein